MLPQVVAAQRLPLKAASLGVKAALMGVLFVLLVHGSFGEGVPGAVVGRPTVHLSQEAVADFLFAERHTTCSLCPIKSRGEPSLWFSLRYFFSRKAPLHSNEFVHHARACLEHAITQVHGQQHVVRDVADAVLVKLLHPRQPLVMHFAGDNGVGKTFLARLVSQALSLRCGNPECTAGDALLVVSGTAYDGIPIAEARAHIVSHVVQHARRFPHGIILLDDLTEMNPELVQMLTPLLGRSEVFPEAPDVMLPWLTVIITTDFGREGRARGKSVLELEQFILLEFRAVYSHAAASMVRTFAFLPIGRGTAISIGESELQQLVCRYPNVIAVSHEAAVVRQIVRDVESRGLLLGENGRAVQQAVRDVSAQLISRALLEKGAAFAFRAHFAWRPTDGAVVLYAISADDETISAHESRHGFLSDL